MRKAWKVSSPVPKAIINEIRKTVYKAKPSEVTIILHWAKPIEQQIELPIIEKCVVCGKPIPKRKGWQIGYLFTDSGKSTTKSPALFDSVDCVNKWLEEYQSPIFQNQKAKELFKKEHPILWAKITRKTLVLSDLVVENYIEKEMEAIA